jgi:hypothetical protein
VCVVNAHEEPDAQLHSYLTFAVDGVEWLASTWPLYTQGKRPCYPLCRGLNGPYSWSVFFGMENLVPLPGIEQ